MAGKRHGRKKAKPFCILEMHVSLVQCPQCARPHSLEWKTREVGLCASPMIQSLGVCSLHMLWPNSSGGLPP